MSGSQKLGTTAGWGRGFCLLFSEAERRLDFTDVDSESFLGKLDAPATSNEVIADWLWQAARELVRLASPVCVSSPEVHRLRAGQKIFQMSKKERCEAAKLAAEDAAVSGDPQKTQLEIHPVRECPAQFFGSVEEFDEWKRDLMDRAEENRAPDSL